ncbi:MAG: C1 family peptidase [Niabella sp.]
MRRIFVFALMLSFVMSNAAYGQDNLVKKASESANATGVSGYVFTHVIDLSTTPIENQGSSGTCWSYSANSFLESEMIKAGKRPVPLSKIYTARKQYEDKADMYVRLGGTLSWGDGGEAHDVVNMYKKYGAIPQSVYTGLINGQTVNNFSEMQAVIQAIIGAIVKVENRTPTWKQAVSGTLDAYLGAVPKTFIYEGKTYTPQTFAKEYVGLNADNYTEFISQTNTPYYEKALMAIPNNWSYQWDYNITPQEITDIIDNALKNGYTVSWGTDVSEPYFSWPNGVAYVPENATKLDAKRMTKEDRAKLFNGPQKEMTITAEARQQALENGTTTDDHGMHIVGLAKDQNGKEYYIVKNSWGETNSYKGFLYVTKAFVQYKTTSILVNNKAVPASIWKLLKS